MLHIHAINEPLSYTWRKDHYTNDVIILTAQELLANIMNDKSISLFAGPFVLHHSPKSNI